MWNHENLIIPFEVLLKSNILHSEKIDHTYLFAAFLKSTIIDISRVPSWPGKFETGSQETGREAVPVS